MLVQRYVKLIRGQDKKVIASAMFGESFCPGQILLERLNSEVCLLKAAGWRVVAVWTSPFKVEPCKSS